MDSSTVTAVTTENPANKESTPQDAGGEDKRVSSSSAGEQKLGSPFNFNSRLSRISKSFKRRSASKSEEEPQEVKAPKEEIEVVVETVKDALDLLKRKKQKTKVVVSLTVHSIRYVARIFGFCAAVAP